jgi:hypothetical protein
MRLELAASKYICLVVVTCGLYFSAAPLVLILGLRKLKRVNT